MILVLGPVLIVAGSLAFCRWAKVDRQPPGTNQVVLDVDRPDQPMARGTSEAGQRRPAAEAAEQPAADVADSRTSRPDERLAAACRQTAQELAPRLGRGCGVIVRPPFVVAGNLAERGLDGWHRRTIGPAAGAMAASYFSIPPDQPITVLLFKGEESYNHFARELFGDEGVSVYGYYKPHVRTLVMNIDTGGGTLVHELTHALIDFDFPDVADWFNEGLASLHEQCRFRPDESGIDGLENWRLPGLKQAIRRKRLSSLEALVAGDDFRGGDVGLNYAQARYFCLFMQRADNPRGQDVLGEFYRLFRETQQVDPSGAAALRRVFADQSWAELDQAFRQWVLKLKS